MKNFLKLLALVLVVVLAISVFVACKDTGDNGGNTGDNSGNTGDNGGNTGDNGGNTGDNSGNTGDNSGNTGDNSGNTGDNGGNTGDNSGNTGDNSGNTGDNSGNTGGSSSSNKKKFTVKFLFVDPDGNEFEDPYIRSVNRNESAREPSVVDDFGFHEKWVVIGWDSDGDGVADDGFKKVTQNLNVYALIRAKVPVTATFTDAQGNTIATKTVFEGESISEFAANEVATPSKAGHYFIAWENVTDGDYSHTGMIVSNCTFAPVFNKADGVIPLVNATIGVDGKKDDIYNSGTYLPLNNKRQADGSKMQPNVEGNYGVSTSTRFESDTTAGAWLVWDGDYVYVMVEVFDTSLSYRSVAYLNKVANAWYNDTVELWYSFEQEAKLSNSTKVGVDAAGYKKYSANRANGIGSGRSTHFGEIEYATSCAIVGAGVNDTTLDATGETLPSYRVELKIPAKTEGKADTVNYPNIDEKTGYIGSDLSIYDPDDALDRVILEQIYTDDSNYAFTDGKKLTAGNCARFSLQINDLMVPRSVLEDTTSGCYEKVDGVTSQRTYNQSYLWSDSTAATEVYPKISAMAQTQYDPNLYVIFSLGGEGEAASWEIGGYTAAQEFLAKDGTTVYERATATN